MKTDLRPAFYTLPRGGWQDYVTLLHLPYTTWHLSYCVLGAAAAPVVYLDRVAGLVLAFFLAVGLGAHALDELHSRPLDTRIPAGWLLVVAGFSLGGALLIGIVASITISLWAVPFVMFGGFIVPAYSLEWARGKFHSDVWFGLAWGAFPVLVGYCANAGRLDVQALLVAAACFGLSLAQRTLSKQARGIRRQALAASGQISFQDGHEETITREYLLAVPESVLQLIGVSVAFLATGWLVARI